MIWRSQRRGLFGDPGSFVCLNAMRSLRLEVRGPVSEGSLAFREHLESEHLEIASAPSRRRRPTKAAASSSISALFMRTTALTR
jgi:hypothetical protein